MNKEIDYAEQLLEAMKVVSQAEVQGIHFDRTIQCTVTNIEDAENGVYMVNNGSASFIAYSKDTDYKVKDNVLVTIPQGDYNQQKIIIGKYVAKNSKPFVYKNPFDYFVDITGNLVSNSHGEFSILANDVTNDLVCPEGPIAYWTCLGSASEAPLSGYETLGLKADFMSLLKGFKVTSGNYGLRVLVTYLNPSANVSDDSQKQIFYNDVLNHYNAINNLILNIRQNDAATKAVINSAAQEVYGADIFQQLQTNLDNLHDQFFKQQSISEEEYLSAKKVLIDSANQAHEDKIQSLNILAQVLLEDRISHWDSLISAMHYSDNADTIKNFLKEQEIINTDLRQELNDIANYSQKAFYLDIDDMYGDPYDFDTYYEQQAIFDISDLDQIVAIQVDLYQSWDLDSDNHMVGSFKDEMGQLISYRDEIFDDELYNDNIFVKDIYLALGYDESQFDTDKLILYTPNNLTYSSIATNDVNTKKIKARWIHKNEDGEVVIINDLADIPTAELRWYRYKLSAAAADMYSSTHWRSITTTDTEIFPAALADIWNCTLVPNPELNTEQIKAILIYGSTVVRSNILAFTNEIAVPDGATVQQLEDFYLEPADGLNGIYNFYGNDNKILNRTTDDDGTELSLPMLPQQEIRHLNTMIKGSQLQDIEYIRWSIPWRYSMIIPTNEHGQPLFTIQNNNGIDYPVKNTANLSRWIFSYDDNFIYLSYPNAVPVDYTKMDNWDWLFYYTIKETLVKAYTNNSVTCEIIKDRITYSYTYNFRFGYNSTNGSDYTLLLSFLPFEDTEPADIAMKVAGDTSGHLRVHLDVMDQNGTILDWHNNTIFGNVTTKWSWATSIVEHSYTAKYVQIAHDNIPQYRKKLADINTNADGTLAIPQYYILNDVTAQEATSYRTVASGAYDDTWEVINNNRYRKVNYATKVYVKTITTAPNITLHSSKAAAGISTYLTGKYPDIYLQSTAALTMNELYVLQVELSGLLPYDLVAYLPIPLYKPYAINNITYKPTFVGPDLIRYDSLGAIDYFKDPCKVIWSTTGQYVVNSFNTANESFNLLIPPADTAGYSTYDTEKDYGYLNINNVLLPLSVYLEDNPPYGIQYSYEGEIYWTQPIYCYQNKWPNGTINKWDGAGLLINEEAGYIVGHSITAGKKESDNSFTGVMLGDLAGSHTNLEDALSKTTGVYGFNHGTLSYAFKDDGTAFIGKSGHGRIEFNGNTGHIKSSSWDESTVPHGMLLDLDDGYLKMVRQGYYTVVTIPNESVYNTQINSANGLYTYTLYSLRTNSRRDASETYYLPRLFIQPEVTITADNYKANVFYIEETVSQDFTLDDSNVEINSSKSITRAGNESLINQKTTEQTNVQRLVINNNQPTFTYTIKTWTYGASLNDSTKLDYYVCNTVDYTYTLATDTWSNISSNASKLRLPDETSFTAATADELNAWTIPISWFYILVSDYQLCVTGNYWPLETYYTKDSAGRYIDIGVNQPTYPLAIGSQISLSARPFRVTWDGHVYITDGDFTGNINAKGGTLGTLTVTGKLTGGIIEGATIRGSSIYGAYIEADELFCYDGNLGGWYVGSEGLWNYAYQIGASEGGLFLGSKNRGIELYDTHIKIKSTKEMSEATFATETDVGYIGSVTGKPNNTGYWQPGIGLVYYGGSNNLRATLKVTGYNVGASLVVGSRQSSFSYQYNTAGSSPQMQLSLNNVDSFAFSTRVDGTLQPSSGTTGSLQAHYITINSGSTLNLMQNGIGAIIINNSSSYNETSMGSFHIHFNVPAANQHGIYARFA